MSGYNSKCKYAWCIIHLRLWLSCHFLFFFWCIECNGDIERLSTHRKSWRLPDTTICCLFFCFHRWLFFHDTLVPSQCLEKPNSNLIREFQKEFSSIAFDFKSNTIQILYSFPLCNVQLWNFVFQCPKSRFYRYFPLSTTYAAFSQSINVERLCKQRDRASGISQYNQKAVLSTSHFDRQFRNATFMAVCCAQKNTLLWFQSRSAIYQPFRQKLHQSQLYLHDINSTWCL